MAVLYVVAAWLIMQVAEVIVTLAGLPSWVGQIVLALLAIGFPIALLFSWFYELTPEGLSLEKEIDPGDSITHVTGRRIDVIVISLLSAAVILFAWHTWWSPAQVGRTAASGGTIESIAVLPLDNLSNDPAQEYFVEGMQDALITRLSRITDLRVISRTSTLRYGSTDKSIPEIARELGVDALIEGAVLRDEDRIRITAKLIRGVEDQPVWANSYDRNLSQVLALISEISLAIADEIEVAVKHRHTDEKTQTGAFDFEVHELVLQGDFFFNRFRFDQSIAYYQQAIAKDADYAPAYAGLAGSHLLQGYFGLAPSSESVPKAREAALRAISLDSNSAGGYGTLGGIQLYYDWDWDLAEKNLLQALALAPNDARTRHAYADYLLVIGDLEESLNQVEIGYLYDPLSPMASLVLDGHRIYAQRYDEVIEKGRKALAEDQNPETRLVMYQEALWLSGMKEEAIATYKKTWGRDEELLRALNTGYSESGYTGAIRSLADALAGREAFREYVTIAGLYARAGEPALAMEWLEKAYQHRQPRILHIKASPIFHELHSSAAFQDLVRRIGFPEASPL
jgi:TolB-like protein